MIDSSVYDQIVFIFSGIESDSFENYPGHDIYLITDKFYYEYPAHILVSSFFSDYEKEIFYNLENFSYFEYEETPDRWGNVGIKLHDKGVLCFYLNSDTKTNTINEKIWSTILKKAAYQASLEDDNLKKFKTILDSINDSLCILSL